ncbi:hypothetical protein GF327_00755 [Candidatus Woesearchaeota archaeon]|nr:hypothetical protein [Candidatus Woesearchaeota archaeon]
MTELKQIIELAVKEEEYFYNLYKKGAKETDIESAKRLFNRLAEEEQGHKEKLLSLDIGNLRESFKPVESIELDKELMLTPLNEIKTLKEIFKMSIQSERKANERYNFLGKSVDDIKAKRMFGFLAGEEKKHEELLKNELAKLDI